MLNAETRAFWAAAGVALIAARTRDGLAVPEGFVREVAELRDWVRRGQEGSRLDDLGCSCHGPRMDPLLLTLPQVAELLATSESTVKRLARDGKLLPVRVAGAEGSLRWRRADLDAYVAGLAGRGQVVTKAAVPGGEPTRGTGPVAPAAPLHGRPAQSGPEVRDGGLSGTAGRGRTG